MSLLTVLNECLSEYRKEYTLIEINRALNRASGFSHKVHDLFGFFASKKISFYFEYESIKKGGEVYQRGEGVYGVRSCDKTDRIEFKCDLQSIKNIRMFSFQEKLQRNGELRAVEVDYSKNDLLELDYKVSIRFLDRVEIFINKKPFYLCGAPYVAHETGLIIDKNYEFAQPETLQHPIEIYCNDLIIKKSELLAAIKSRFVRTKSHEEEYEKLSDLKKWRVDVIETAVNYLDINEYISKSGDKKRIKAESIHRAKDMRKKNYMFPSTRSSFDDSWRDAIMTGRVPLIKEK